MFCSKCGTQSVSGERFCRNCGYALENVNPSNFQSQQLMEQQPQEQAYVQTNMNTNVGQQMYNTQNVNNVPNSYGNLNPNYVQKAVNPNMDKWVILSIIIPVVGLIWYYFIGLSFYLAIMIAGVGFSFAQKGELVNKKLAVIGKVLNGILCGMAIVMLILQLIQIFAS